MKTILLTGATGGIGSTIKEILERAGDKVMAIAHSDADLTSYSSIESLEKKVSKKIDWIICAHGFIINETELEKQSPEDILKTFEVNAVSMAYIAKALLPHLNPGGGMIFLSSTSALSPNGRYAAYSASKAAVNAFAQALARNKPEFTFIAVCPGPTNTSMRENLAHDAAKQQSPTVVAEVVQKIISGESTYQSGDIIVVKNGEISKAGGLN
jgi:NAD(P)-dependent dehydrogenase (short-subunit alcohol dehydrogenase family)